jgi:tetratricopeptide (TPR) repeat protein
LIFIAGAAYLLMAKSGKSSKSSLSWLLSGAVITSTFVILLHGLVDDALYGELGSPLLLLIPGLAILLTMETLPTTGEEPINEVPDLSSNHSRSSFTKLLIPGVLVAAILLGVFVFRKPIFASWYANLGAVQMAKYDLANWPKDQWNADPQVSQLESAQQLFDKAAALNPNQRTAWHRSGLIAAQARNFDTAQDELERAHIIDPAHRGIKKSLGYIYAWNGQFDQAALLLEEIDEAKDEMEVYAWWWEENNQSELADLADDMARILKLEKSTP